MVTLEVIKSMADQEVVLRFDDECEVVFTLTAFQQLAEKLEVIAGDGQNHMAHWLFDPEDNEDNVGYEERDVFAEEDE